MSHHTRIATKITSPDAAGDALRDMFPDATVDVDTTGRIVANLYGSQTAAGCVAVARRIGFYGEDVAIVRGADGTCHLQADTHTIARFEQTHGRPMPAELARRAGYHTIIRYARANGLDVVADSTAVAVAGRV